MAERRTALLTGATGFIGSALAHRLLRRGESPLLLARPKSGESGRKRILASLELIEAAAGVAVDRSLVRVLEGDVAEPGLGLSRGDLQRAASEAGTMIHAAALVSFDPAAAADVMRCNVEGTRNVIEVCRTFGAALHHVSTAFACGQVAGDIAEEHLAKPPAFRNAYERSKWEAEELVAAAVKEDGLEALVFRPSIVLGERKSGFTPVFSTLYRWFHAVDLLRQHVARRAAAAGPVDLDLRFPVDPDGVMSIVPADYVADAILYIGRKAKPDGSVFHLVTRNVPPNREHLRLVMEALGVRGITLVSRGDPAAAALTDRERRLVAAVAEYRAYFDCRVDFEDGRAARFLRGSGIAAPVVDQAYTSAVIGYARRTGWGRTSARGAAAPPRHAPEPAGVADSRPGGTATPQPAQPGGATAPEPAELAAARRFFTVHLAAFQGRALIPDLQSLDAVFSVVLTDAEPARRGCELASYTVRVAGARIAGIVAGAAADAGFRFLVPVRVFLEIAAGRLDPRESFFAGKSEIEGDLAAALAIIPVLKRFFEEHPFDAEAG